VSEGEFQGVKGIMTWAKEKDTPTKSKYWLCW
jgi:hypothetical protein